MGLHQKTYEKEHCTERKDSDEGGVKPVDKENADDNNDASNVMPMFGTIILNIVFAKIFSIKLSI